jgi:hypothetical protein
LLFAVAFLISLVTVPALFLKLIEALETDIALILITIVPSKSVVGVIERVPVLVARGPTAPVALNPEVVTPPNKILNEPAVLPVTV